MKRSDEAWYVRRCRRSGIIGQASMFRVSPRVCNVRYVVFWNWSNREWFSFAFLVVGRSHVGRLASGATDGLR